MWMYQWAAPNRTFITTTARTTSRRWWQRLEARRVKVVGVIGTEAGLSDNESGMVRLPDRYSANKLAEHFPVVLPSVTIDQLDQDKCAAHPGT